jgi:hypothetical protein
MRERVWAFATVAVFIVALASRGGAKGGPGGVPSSGNGQPCFGVPPAAPDYSFKHDCATPTPTPQPASSTLTIPTNLAQMSLGGSKYRGSTQPEDEYWMPAVSSFFDNIETWGDYNEYRNTFSNAGQYGAYASMSRTDETCPAMDGAVCRKPIFDQREQDFMHDDDPALLSGDPIIGGVSGSTAGCTWYWKPDDRGEVGGYKIYDGTNNSLIASIVHGTTTFAETGLTNDTTTYFRYVDSILVSDSISAAITTTNVPVSVTTSGVGTNILAHTRLHIQDGASSEDVEVLSTPAPFLNAMGHTVFSIINTVNTYHANSTIINESAYSGTDSLDTTTSAMANTTQPNLGTRLPGNLTGNNNTVSPQKPNVIANCKPRATPPPASARVLAHFVIAEQPTPYPPPPGMHPVSPAQITFTGSVDEVAANPQATPTMNVFNNSDGSGGTVVAATTTWAKSNCGTNCLTWTLSAPLPTVTDNATMNGSFGPIDAQFLVAVNTTGPWMNYARNNRVMNPAYKTNNAAMQASCPYQMSLDHEDLLDDLITLTTTLQNPNSGFNQIDTEETGFFLSAKDTDITPANDPFLLDAGSYTNCTEFVQGPNLINYFAGAIGYPGTHHGSYPPPISQTPLVEYIPEWNTPWSISWDDALIENQGANPSPSGPPQCPHCWFINSPATVAAQSGLTVSRLFDTAFYATGVLPNANQWEGQAVTALEDGNILGPLGAPNPILDISFESVGSTGTATTTYWVRGNDLLVQQYPLFSSLGNSAPPNFIDDNVPYNNSYGYQPMFPVQYAPIGFPIEPLIPYAIPTCTPLPTCTPSGGTAGILGTDIWNSVDQLFERWYTNGVVMMCGDTNVYPPMTGGNCHGHTFPQTVYVLNVDSGVNAGTAPTGSITGCTSGNGILPPSCARTYTQETTTGPMGRNTIQIILFSPL